MSIDKEATQKLREQLDSGYTPTRKERERKSTEDTREQIQRFNES